MLIEVSAQDIERLISCRNTRKRGFKEWELNSLIHEAVLEFHKKYGEKK